jgi:hypothetical protein
VGYVGAVTDAARAAELIRKAVADPRKPFTVADASTAAGIPLRDAETGLNVLTSEYRGHLRVSEDGDLVHVFPNGFTKPWAKTELLDRIGAALMGVGRFVVRAWLLVVMVAYAALFVALLVGLMFAGKSNDRDDRSGIGDLLGVILRVLFDALYWTFHPWSPFYIEGSRFAGYGERRERARDETPFYEKVNRFVFGPRESAPSPEQIRAKVLAEIRAKKGRIGLADVMRITGLPRDQADPMMARLMMDHDGTVHVGEQGGIVYRFESMRRTADEAPQRPARPAWETPPELPPLTGNEGGANVGIAALNLFNAAAAAFAFANDWTIANVLHLFEHRPPHTPPTFEPGTAIALGIVPLVFSIGVLALPALRAAFRGRKEKQLAEEKARLGILKEVLARAPQKEPVPDDVLQTAYRIATGETPTSKEITARVVELGGDVDVGPEGEVRYRFADFEAEAEALEEEREAASEKEARLGKIIFTSE